MACRCSGCWARLLVQNAAWQFGASICWYLVSSFAGGLQWGAGGFVEASWPSTGHFETTALVFATAQWTSTASPGWRLLPCPEMNDTCTLRQQGCNGSVLNCALPRGGNYVALASPDWSEFTLHMQMMRRMGDRQFTFYHEPEARSQHNCRHCNPCRIPACKCLSMNVPPHTRFCKQCPHHPEFHLSFSHALFADDCGEVSMLQDAYERLDAHIADAMETA